MTTGTGSRRIFSGCFRYDKRRCRAKQANRRDNGDKRIRPNTEGCCQCRSKNAWNFIFIVSAGCFCIGADEGTVDYSLLALLRRVNVMPSCFSLRYRCVRSKPTFCATRLMLWFSC